MASFCKNLQWLHALPNLAFPPDSSEREEKTSQFSLSGLLGVLRYLVVVSLGTDIVHTNRIASGCT